MTLTPEQINQLLKPVNTSRVRKREGNSYMEAHDIKAHLTRVFGFGNYDSDVFDLALLYERPGKNKSGGEAMSVGYRAGVRLTVRTPHGDTLATYTEYAAAGATNYPINKLADAHDMAMKSAASYALKRCAIHLGDQFGLSLYNNGSTNAFVGGTLVRADKPSAPDDVVVSDETEPSPNESHEHPEGVSVSADQFIKPRETGEVPSQAQTNKMYAALADRKLTDRDDILEYVSNIVGRDVTSSKELTRNDVHLIINSLEGAPTE